MERNKVKLELVYLNDRDVCLEDRAIYLSGNQILYDQISKIKVMLVNEIRSIGSTYSNVQFDYYLDLDVYVGDNIYYYQVNDKYYVNEMFEILKENNVDIEDMMNLIKIYQEYPDYHQRYEYFRFEYRKWAKQYGLDNPRGIKAANDAKNKY